MREDESGDSEDDDELPCVIGGESEGNNNTIVRGAFKEFVDRHS